MKVRLFATCSAELLYPAAPEAAVEVLESLGVEVLFPTGQVCCGQPWLNMGHPGGAKELAGTFAEVFEGPEPIVAVSASCVDTIRNRLPGLYPEGSPEQESLRLLASRTFEFVEFLHGVLKFTDPPAHPEPPVVTYHSSCRTLRGLELVGVVEEYCARLFGEAFRPLPDAEVCCGFGGSFSVKLPEISTKLMDDKLDAILSTGASQVVSLDLGCLTHLKGGADRRGLGKIRFRHFSELLAEALRGGHQ